MVIRPASRTPPVLQFPIFLGVSVAAIFIGYVIAMLLVMVLYGSNTLIAISQLNFSKPQTVSALWLLQIVSTTIPIFAAPVFFAYVIVKESGSYLKPGLRFPPMLFIIAFMVMLVSTPVIEFLSNINQKLVLPHYLSGLEKWMRSSEDQAQALTKAVLKMDSIGDVIKAVLLVGLLTAIAEEFMFRGVLQTIMQRWTKSTHAAIWITAALFSAFHMEFYGFLPRMLLGALFGYFVAWSGSIWPAVWGHFLNNGTAVVVTYLYNKKQTKLNPDATDSFSSFQYVFSALIIIILLLVYKHMAEGKAKPQIDGEELG